MTKPPQARNAIWRALLHVAGVRFSDNYKERCRRYVGNECAYCGIRLEKGSTKGHYDHAVALASASETFHLVYACRKCNSYEKLEMGWQTFLDMKCPDKKVCQRRLSA